MSTRVHIELTVPQYHELSYVIKAAQVLTERRQAEVDAEFQRRTSDGEPADPEAYKEAHRVHLALSAMAEFMLPEQR